MSHPRKTPLIFKEESDASLLNRLDRPNDGQIFSLQDSTGKLLAVVAFQPDFKLITDIHHPDRCFVSEPDTLAHIMREFMDRTDGALTVNTREFTYASPFHSTAGATLHGLTLEGSIDLSGPNHTLHPLPTNLRINGSLSIDHHSLTALPAGMFVGQNLTLGKRAPNLKEIGANMRVGGNMAIHRELEVSERIGRIVVHSGLVVTGRTFIDGTSQAVDFRSPVTFHGGITF